MYCLRNGASAKCCNRNTNVSASSRCTGDSYLPPACTSRSEPSAGSENTAAETVRFDGERERITIGKQRVITRTNILALYIRRKQSGIAGCSFQNPQKYQKILNFSEARFANRTLY